MMPKPNQQKGFSLVELTVVSTLMALLAMLLSSAWFGMGRTATDLIGRGQLVQERDLAVAALSRDLGGCLIDPDARLGEKINGRWLKWELPSNQELKLYYDGGTNSSGVPLANTVVHYLVESGLLKRKKTVNGGTPTDFTVAKNVYSMTVTLDGTPIPNAVNIVLCFKYRTRTLTCDLTAKQPSSPPAIPEPPLLSEPPFPTLPWSIDHFTNP